MMGGLLYSVNRKKKILSTPQSIPFQIQLIQIYIHHPSISIKKMKQAKESQPFIIHSVLMPTPDSSFVSKLILAYSHKLQNQNSQFQSQFQQKQSKLSRHQDQLKLLNEMKQDHLLRQQVLHQIELKHYQKDYQSLFATDQFNLNTPKPLSYKLKTPYKQYRSFHLGNHQSKSKEKSFQCSKPQQISSFGKHESNRKFRSSLIKSGSFSTINKKKTPFSNQTNNIQTTFRDSADSQSLLRDANFKNEPILKKKPIVNLERQHKIQKNFVKCKEVVKNAILQNFQDEEQQKLMRIDIQQIENKQNCDTKYFHSKNENQEEQRITKRIYLKTTSSQFPEVSLKLSSQPKCENRQKETGRSWNKSDIKQKQQSPYQVSNFLRQLNSYHYVSQYNQVKKQTKRANIKRQ